MIQPTMTNNQEIYSRARAREESKDISKSSSRKNSKPGFAMMLAMGSGSLHGIPGGISIMLALQNLLRGKVVGRPWKKHVVCAVEKIYDAFL